MAGSNRHDSYIAGYPDRAAMGSIEPDRVQVRLLKPDLHSLLPGGRSIFRPPTEDREYHDVESSPI